MTTGERIKEMRSKLGITQEELAKRCGYKSRSSINKLELSRDLSLKTVGKIADALGCDAAYLVGWEDNLTDDNAHAMARMIKGEPVSPALYQYAVDAVLLQKINSLNEEEKKQVHNFVDFLISKKVTEENN